MTEELHWYNNAIIYALDIGSFKDGNGDGIGDFIGAKENADYFEELGINCIWLLPFFESQERDNGYDVDNYYSINRKFGTFDDFLDFKAEVEKRNIRLIIDLVVHHTSDNHPWFKLAVHNTNSKYYHYYKWNKTPPVITEENIFKGEENNTWEYCETNDQYYYHKFYSFQPDLNILNPDVQHEIKEIIRFWLGFGVSGFRLDAATHLFDEFEDSYEKSPGDFMEELHDFMISIKKDAFFLAEADVPKSRIKTFIGKGNRMNLLFNFLLNNKTFLALARGEPGPITEQLTSHQKLPSNVQWANFIRNLDELDLERLTKDEREEVFAAFAPRDNMKVFDRGIRRRIAPMVSGNINCNKMIFSLLFALPGIPVIVYGDEIGMGDNLVYKGRNAVRTPMQWDSSPNGGFSTAPAEQLQIKAIAEGIFSYHFTNVEDQKAHDSSLFSEISRFISLRKTLATLLLKHPRIVDTGVKEVMGLNYSNELFIFINFSPHPMEVRIDFNLDEYEDLMDDSSYHLKNRSDRLPLKTFGYRWLRKKAEK